MTRRQQLTFITGGFVIISLVVLGMRWSVLAERVPLAVPASAAGAVKQKTSTKSKTKSNYSPTAKQKYYKPSKSNTNKPTQKKQSPAGLVDINKASATELEALPGIGEVLAKRVVAYRNSHGPFTKLSELAKVEGIGAKKLEGLDGRVTY